MTGKVSITVEPSRYAPNRVIIIRVDGKEAGRDMLQDRPADAIEKWLAGHTYYALRHPELGYIHFRSYSSAVASQTPNPRSLFRNRRDAEKRRGKHFWIKQKDRHEGSELEIVKISMIWREEEIDDE